MVFFAWPAELFPVPEDLAPQHRVSALKVARPHQRPVLLLNVYLQANDKYAAGHTLARLFAWAAELGEDISI